ncbi:hypothetical protein Rleg10DRAFT_6680 [Rhizobium leguminosarum bv. trifolii WSM2012]|nr:hypothetical protein Rleg10DRAFT_6680 [Rhizobium leguminosarum bv. trifolii WSM2012]
MSIADDLNKKGATPETILQVLDSTVFEASGDLSPDEMMSNLKAAVDDEADVDEALETLRKHPELVNEIALRWIAHAAQQPETEQMVSEAIGDADRQMPMLEIGAITLVALYAIYTFGPNKPTNEKWTIRQRKDGTFEEIKSEAGYADFSEPVKAFLGLFSGARKAKK